MTRSVLVTGCSTGFGLEISLYLAEHGFQVYASLRNMAHSERVEAAAAARQVNLRLIHLDVTDRASIDTTMQTIISETGNIYGVVNNAGLFLRGYFEDLADSEIRQVFETNLFGTMAVTRAALPHMHAARQGRIVVISSVAGKIGAPSGSAYSASRFAQEGFVESLYQEVAPLGVRAILVEPGITKTESWTIDRNAAAAARNPDSPYYAWFCQAEQLFHQAMQSSPITTRDIAKAVHQALTAERPRLRYMVGRRALLVMLLRRYLPERLFERVYFGEVMRRVTGVRQHRP